MDDPLVLQLLLQPPPSSPTNPNRGPHPLLALTPHISTLAYIAWVHVRAARNRRQSQQVGANSNRSTGQEERPLLSDSSSRSDTAKTFQREITPARGTGYELVLEVLGVLSGAGLLAVTLAKLVAFSSGGKWDKILLGGVVGLTVYLGLISAVKIVEERVEKVVREQQVAVVLVLFTTVFFDSVYPFAFLDHPPLSTSSRVGFAQTALALTLGALLLLTPPRFHPRLKGVLPNPAQTASPLSLLFFSFLEPRMIRYYVLTSPRLTRLFRLVSSSPSSKLAEEAGGIEDKVDFRGFVPPLPDVLHSDFVLSRFKWDVSGEGEGEGDSNGRKDKTGAEAVNGGEEGEGQEGGGAQKKGKERGTVKAFARHHRGELIKVLAFASGWIVFIFVSPLSMNLLLRYIQRTSSSPPPFNLNPYTFVLLLFLSPILQSVCYQSALYLLAQLGLRMRAVLGVEVVGKVMRVLAGGGGGGGGGGERGGKGKGAKDGKKAKGDGKTMEENGEDEEGEKEKAGGGSEAVGRVNNLVGTDIDTITSSLPTFLQLLSIPPKLIISLLALYLLLGWSAFVALGAILLFAPVSKSVAGRYGGVQGEIMKATDKRITLVQELLGSIRIIKMFHWEEASMKNIGEARERELERIGGRAKVYAGMMLLSTGIPAVVTLSTFGAFVFLQKETLEASTAFTAMSLFGLLREAVISATYLLSAFMRARVSLDRISTFLTKTEELDPHSRTFVSPSSSGPSNSPHSPSSNESAITIAPNSTFRFSRRTPSSSPSSDFTLQLSSPSSASSKGKNNNPSSTALEIPRGKITIVAGDVGSGKSAFLLALLGEMCVDEGGGVEISVDGEEEGKGERQRVPVGYAAQGAWLQDTSVRNNILFGAPWDEERYNQTVFACALEDDLDALPEGDETRVGEKGLSLSGGQKQRVALARAIYSSTSLLLLDDILSALDTQLVSHVLEYCLNGPLVANRTVILVTHFVKMCTKKLDNVGLVFRLREGRVLEVGPPGEGLRVGENGGEGSRISRRSSRGSMGSRGSGSGGSRSRLKEAEVKHGWDGADQEEEDEKADSSGEGNELGWEFYRRYARACGGWKFWAAYGVVNVVAHVFMLAQGWYIGRWVNAPDGHSHAARYFSVYAAIQVISSVSLTAMYLALIWGAIKASRKLHEGLTARVFGAPFRWWDRTPLGAVTNRFSKDTEIVDTEQVENLQPVLDYSVQVFFVAIIITVILPIFLLPASIIALIFFFLGNLYIRNALAARKAVSNSRSPLFSTLGDTTGGIVTIRAFKREEAFMERYKQQTDEYNKAQLYEEALDRWLEERSDSVGAAVSFVVGLLCLSSGLSSGVTGFLISTGLEFTSRILYVVRAINKNELSFNSTQRILQYSEVEVEEPSSEKKEPPAHWPSEGGIEFDGFSARYSEDGEDVLHDLNLTIKPGEKIGIVGPSGCGKSSFSLALLRFILKSSGYIKVDGRALDETNLSAIRSRMTLVPQDPTLFSGTLRTNLDPNAEHDDATLWNAIQRSGFVKQGDERITLDSPVASSGSNLSQGQRQLIGLARALVRGSRIVILDEATASLDNESDALVQRVIREEFEGATNITVAHRLESVIDYDRILVMRAGRVVEFDTPLALLEDEDGAFRKMVEATGSFDELYEKTKEAAKLGARVRLLDTS
ncbi:hypothetical protein JCM11641_006904 [Rhodosporidiobolus odoratus]